MDCTTGLSCEPGTGPRHSGEGRGTQRPGLRLIGLLLWEGQGNADGSHSGTGHRAHVLRCLQAQQSWGNQCGQGSGHWRKRSLESGLVFPLDQLLPPGMVELPSWLALPTHPPAPGLGEAQAPELPSPPSLPVNSQAGPLPSTSWCLLRSPGARHACSPPSWPAGKRGVAQPPS